ncbi:hypothetical protein ACFVYE_40350 [Streptomyces sp. NPDC058239]|uniref:hypothetical protein n=1 Tax=Streptomyces sp. NPDC058239 TaxID=3346395 RepID=UPI0036E10D07
MFDPVGGDRGRQPCRGGCGQGFQRRAQGLADELHPVQRPHRGQDMGGVGALPTARAQQSELGAPGQDQVQDALLQSVPDQSGAEVTQDGEIEPRVI